MHWGPDDLAGTVLASWGEKEWLRFGIEIRIGCSPSFMHGEQGAMLCTAKNRRDGAVDRRQVLRRHPGQWTRPATSRSISKYLDTKLSGHYPMNGHLGLLLDDIVSDSRWDMTYLGMQIMVEGLALAPSGSSTP